MPRSKHKRQFRTILRTLNANSGGDITSSATMTSDGFILGSQLQAGVDQDRFAAMCASLLALAEQTSDEIAIGSMQQLMIMGPEGVMMLRSVGKDTVLAVSARPKASLGKVLLYTKQAAADIARVMG